MATGTAWALNLDADLELGAGSTYRTSQRVLLAMKAPIARLAASLLGPDDVLVDEASPEGRADGLVGRAFCPTPRAIHALLRAGATPEPHPPVDVLRGVNSRAFAAALGPTLPGAAFVTDVNRARAMLRERPPTGSAWRIKHAFGMAGRNQRVIRPTAIAKRDLAFVSLGLAHGGVQIEPNVELDEEYAVHGVIGEGGAVCIGPVLGQRCDAHGAWLATEPLGSRARATGAIDVDYVARRLAAEAHQVARALLEAGYFGPFGVDAYAYRDGDELRLQPRSEINARYSMGFPRALVGPGDRHLL
jgi:hypothetical protein